MFLLQIKPCFALQSSTFQNPVTLETLPTMITQSNIYQAENIP